MVISFKILVNPVPKARPRFTRKGFCYTPKDTKIAEENLLAQAVKYAPEKPFDCAVEVHLKFFKPKPKSKPKKVKYWITKPDLDNFCKTILDSFNKVFWLDDSQVVKIVASKEYGEPARTEVQIFEYEDIDEKNKSRILPDTKADT